MFWLTSWSNSKCALSIVNLCAGSRVPARGVLGVRRNSQVQEDSRLAARRWKEDLRSRPPKRAIPILHHSLSFSLTLLASSVSAATFPY
jgi:hypothetical protein